VRPRQCWDRPHRRRSPSRIRQRFSDVTARRHEQLVTASGSRSQRWSERSPHAAAVAFGYVRADTPAAVTCTVSPSDHDANPVVHGVEADSYCASRARELAWSTRPGLALRSPDLGQELTVVCWARDGGLRITIYDDGRHRIGRNLCDRFAAAG
jgi:hypothetical protein